MNKESTDWLKLNFCENNSRISKKMLLSIPIEIMEDIEEELKNVPEYETINRVAYCISHGIELKKCATCGKTLSYSKAFTFHCRYCSYACIDNERRSMKLKETLKRKYGVDNISQSNAIKEKKRQISLKHYGTENVFQNEEIRAKQRKTCVEKYGVENVFQLEETKLKSKETNRKKYGVEYACQNEVVKQKTIVTNIERYGVENPSQNFKIKDKRNATCIERFGTDNIFKNESFIRANHGKTYDTLKERWKNYVIPLFTKEQYTGHHHDEAYEWKCAKCGSEFESRIYNTSHLKKQCGETVPRCLKCYPICSGFSYDEKEIVEYVRSIYGGVMIENATNVISPLELDIYIPEKKIAIEYNGLYWHSEKQGKGQEYHFRKTATCNDNGIFLIHVFENEWKQCKKIVQDRIRSILGIGQKRIHARKCIVKEVNTNDAELFLNDNHLQGNCHSSIRYGLYYEDELVAVMTFGKPRFSKKYDYELLRFASKIGLHVTGGAGKLLAYFRRSHEGSIISYADRRYSVGNLYEKLGFAKKGVSKPNYFWLKNGRMLTRYQCQKHRLASIIGDAFEETKTEVENMQNEGWTRVFDCGNLVYAMN